MNTSMADGARDRCVAQIGEALFGQPGLNLMELAEKVKGMRPHPPTTALGFPVVIDPAMAPGTFEIRPPSPTGQVDRSKFEAWAKAEGLKTYIYGGYDMYSHPVTRGAWLAWQHLAARQPMGQEPVAYWLAVDEHGIVEFGASTDDANEGHAARQEVNDFINDQLRDDDKQFRLVGVYAAPPAQAVDLAPAVIPDTPEVREILGRPNFWCSPWANVLRIRGDEIPRKAEEEQAAVIRFMLNHYLAHGTEWAEKAGDEMDAIRKADSQEVQP